MRPIPWHALTIGLVFSACHGKVPESSAGAAANSPARGPEPGRVGTVEPPSGSHTGAEPPRADGACEGSPLDLLAAIANETCRVSEEEGDQLRDVLEDPAKAPVSVEASHLGGGRVRVRITNRGSAPLALPLLVHSALDTFPTRADGRPLSAPIPEWPTGFSFDVGRMLVKVTLPPSGYAEAVVRIEPTLVSHEVGDCPPNAKCAPTLVEHGPLGPGDHELRLRTPLYSIRSDLEATIRLTTPVR